MPLYCPCKTLFPCNFQRTFTKVMLCILYSLHHCYLCLSALSPTRTANWCYTHISMLHRKSSYLVLPTVTITHHHDNMLAYSPLERLLSRPPDRNFDTHNHQYNNLNLAIFASAPDLTNRTHEPLTSILASRFASYVVSQQFAKPLH